MSNILEIILTPQFLRALYAVILVSLISATLGTFSVFKESTFTVSTLAHGAWMGAALGILIEENLHGSLDPIYITVIVILSLGLVLSLISRGEEAKQSDVATGVVFGSTISLAVLFSSMLREASSRVLGIIFGDILFLTLDDIITISIITLMSVFTVVIFFEIFLYISFDPEGASAMGIRVGLYETLLLLLTALSIVVLVKTVGAILVYAMLIIPPAAARELSKNPYDVATKTFLLSTASGFSGLFLSIFVNGAPSALMGLISVIFYAVTKVKSSR